MGDTYNITVTGGSFNQYSGGRGRGGGRGGFPTVIPAPGQEAASAGRVGASAH
ncbi:hypothetical protein HYE67_009493 [Fusarium culmorum]|uniref:Uncharacterized protein n=1 Tax=Fusarium culmorum TaxID=5516 RepID=A0A7S8DEY9_FUSCU|nr:hypothetical protein HYE67_009493 [Fusarium culmorum]